MRVPEQWLRAMVNPPIDSEALANALTMAGLEVEDSLPLAPEFSGVVIGRVTAVTPHPDADRLRVCTVDIGQPDMLQIVCGAPNVEAGMVAPCATEGAVLPGGFKIKRAKMRGVESQGMLCSAKELGISEDAEGLLALPESFSATLGKNLREAMNLDARVLEIKLTPNRADCLSIAGVAREVAALTSAPLTTASWPSVVPTVSDKVPVRIEAADLCGRFSGRIVKGVQANAVTPDWMRSRLEQAGQRSISALVDISNYVMLELGRPSHIFDADKIRGPLVVRWARPGESIKLLNEQEFTLDPSVGVIADDHGPESMAGIMGGHATAVSLDTKNVYIEAAFWWPDSIRGRARRFGFSTEAGHRFERGVDWETTVAHVDYITHLIQSICGGAPGPMDDQTLGVPDRAPVSMRVARCCKVLGIAVTAQDCLTIFSRLGLAAEMSKSGAGEVIRVTPPSFRFDLEIEEDLIEEVARIHGFERIPAHPPRATAAIFSRHEASRSSMQLRDRMVAADYVEAITYSFISDEQAEPFLAGASPLRLLNPMASHQSVMRPSLLPGLLEATVANLNRKALRVRLFEIGRTYHDDPAQQSGDWAIAGIRQPLRLAGVAFGFAADEQWGLAARPVDFFDVKGDLQRLAAPAVLTTRKLGAGHQALHPGRSAEVMIGGKPAGFIGELHPRLVQRLELAGAPIVFELELEPLSQATVPRPEEPSKFPPVIRDLALVVGLETPAGAILDRINHLKNQSKQGSWITNVKCFDEYRGKGLSEKEKSLAFRFILQSPEATLQDAEVDQLMADIIKLMQVEFAARLRS
ncbi:MAG: phenylalanine--tRNA ligase subunit beta [Betaproteobacteria bacterium]|nr:phenylalanine--tRNA ligase subunit beta [Betaproteobacteria bacterium]